MNSTRAVALALTLTLILGPTATARAAVPALADAGGLAQCSGTTGQAWRSPVVATRQDAVLVQQSTGELVEILSGAQARAHLYELARRHPARFKTLAVELESRQDYEPTEEVTVARTITFGTAHDRYRDLELPRALPAADTAQTAKGQVIFWSWNDGNKATWEGSMYVEDYKTGKWLTNDGQIDISTADYEPVWAMKTGSGKEDPSDLPVDQRDRLGPDRLRRGTHRLACGLPCALFFATYRSYTVCQTSGCFGCATACILMGPAWPKCSIACCVGTIVQCAITEFLK